MRVEQGERTNESGPRRADQGEWNNESGTRRVEQGEWNKESGTRRVEQGKWNKESGPKRVDKKEWTRKTNRTLTFVMPSAALSPSGVLGGVTGSRTPLVAANLLPDRKQPCAGEEPQKGPVVAILGWTKIGALHVGEEFISANGDRSWLPSLFAEAAPAPSLHPIAVTCLDGGKQEAISAIFPIDDENSDTGTAVDVPISASPIGGKEKTPGFTATPTPSRAVTCTAGSTEYRIFAADTAAMLAVSCTGGEGLDDMHFRPMEIKSGAAQAVMVVVLSGTAPSQVTVQVGRPLGRMERGPGNFTLFTRSGSDGKWLPAAREAGTRLCPRLTV